MSGPGDDLAYRAAVGIMLLNDQGLVFIGKRRGMTESGWQMPQGGIDEGEEPAAAALRELAEEVGTDKAEVLAESKDWLEYDLPEEVRGKVWGGGFRGQRQKWFAMRFLGQDQDIDLNAHNHPEFDDWRWAAMDDLPKLIVPFKRRLYELVVEEFREFRGS